MKLTGVEVAVETLFKLEANTVMVIVSDADGKIKLIKADNHPVPDGDLPDCCVLKLPSGDSGEKGLCLKFINGQWIWVPC